MSAPVIVDGVWKRFPMHRDRPGLKEFVLRFPGFLRERRESSFWALRGVSFTVSKGECLGVIGRNGAGKSTLLSVIMGGIWPTKGKIEVTEKITPLLMLGAGFHPDLTGRENVLLNGVLLGLTIAEMRERMDSIVTFSGIGEFDGMAVRTYSSGMLMRLAFSIAIHTEPSILLIDEVLAVGDEEFQKKSGEALLKLIKSGVTTILVTHSLAQVREICDRVVWLDQGEVRAMGAPAEVVERYSRISTSSLRNK